MKHNSEDLTNPMRKKDKFMQNLTVSKLQNEYDRLTMSASEKLIIPDTKRSIKSLKKDSIESKYLVSNQLNSLN